MKQWWVSPEVRATEFPKGHSRLLDLFDELGEPMSDEEFALYQVTWLFACTE